MPVNPYESPTHCEPTIPRWPARPSSLLFILTFVLELAFFPCVLWFTAAAGPVLVAILAVYLLGLCSELLESN